MGRRRRDRVRVQMAPLPPAWCTCCTLPAAHRPIARAMAASDTSAKSAAEMAAAVATELDTKALLPDRCARGRGGWIAARGLCRWATWQPPPDAAGRARRPRTRGWRPLYHLSIARALHKGLQPQVRAGARRCMDGAAGGVVSSDASAGGAAALQVCSCAGAGWRSLVTVHAAGVGTDDLQAAAARAGTSAAGGAGRGACRGRPRARLRRAMQRARLLPARSSMAYASTWRAAARPAA
jgi:hypothetical protein